MLAGEDEPDSSARQEGRRMEIKSAVAVASISTAWAADPKSCDRDCLKRLTDTYLAATVAHDVKKAPLARDIRFLENLKRTQPGEGLWKTASATPADFKIYVPDPVAQQVGFIGLMQEEGKPILLGLRLKMQDGKISEAEHVIARNLRPNVMDHFKAPSVVFATAVSEPYRDSRGRLLYIGASYYDALDLNNGSLSPFADDCVRFENGIQTARNAVPSAPIPGQSVSPFGALGCAKQLDTQLFEYITSIDNRRVWIADEENGLVFGLSHFRHKMDRKEFRTIGVPGQEVRKMDFQPFDLPAVHIFKIWGGQIHEIEALGFTAPYNSATGWEN
jgi:hypothetical protein